MDTRVVLLGIIVENTAAVEELNAILHNYGSYIIGRMGLPYREKNLHIISIVLDAAAEHYQRACGKIGMLPGVTAKALYAGKQA